MGSMTYLFYDERKADLDDLKADLDDLVQRQNRTVASRDHEGYRNIMTASSLGEMKEIEERLIYVMGFFDCFIDGTYRPGAVEAAKWLAGIRALRQDRIYFLVDTTGNDMAMAEIRQAAAEVGGAILAKDENIAARIDKIIRNFESHLGCW